MHKTSNKTDDISILILYFSVIDQLALRHIKLISYMVIGCVSGILLRA